MGIQTGGAVLDPSFENFKIPRTIKKVEGTVAEKAVDVLICPVTGVKFTRFMGKPAVIMGIHGQILAQQPPVNLPTSAPGVG
jgi:hypothetical protein